MKNVKNYKDGRGLGKIAYSEDDIRRTRQFYELMKSFCGDFDGINRYGSHILEILRAPKEEVGDRFFRLIQAHDFYN